MNAEWVVIGLTAVGMVGTWFGFYIAKERNEAKQQEKLVNIDKNVTILNTQVGDMDKKLDGLCVNYSGFCAQSNARMSNVESRVGDLEYKGR